MGTGLGSVLSEVTVPTLVGGREPIGQTGVPGSGVPWLAGGGLTEEFASKYSTRTSTSTGPVVRAVPLRKASKRSPPVGEERVRHDAVGLWSGRG